LLAIIERFERLFPHCFVAGGRKRHPLKIGIHKDPIAVCNPLVDWGLISVVNIKRALALYDSNSGYSCRKADTARIDLRGTVVGVVKAEADQARQTLKRQGVKRSAVAERADPRRHWHHLAIAENG
jgi:sRNA-binding protein